MAKVFTFTEDGYVNPSNIPSEKRNSLVSRDWRKYIAGGVLAGILMLFIGALLLFLLLSPQRASGSSDFQAWSHEQQAMIDLMRKEISSSIAREADVEGIMIFFNTPNKEQQIGASITFENGFFKVMKIIKNVAPPKNPETTLIG